MNIQPLLEYCYTNSQRKLETAKILFKNKRYADCLFYSHLALEFTLKAKVVETTNKMFPITHDLEFLALKAGIALSKQRKEQLAIISTFNISARYDDYKLSFYKKANMGFASRYFKLSKELLLWIKTYSPDKKPKK